MVARNEKATPFTFTLPSKQSIHIHFSIMLPEVRPENLDFLLAGSDAARGGWLAHVEKQRDIFF